MNHYHHTQTARPALIAIGACIGLIGAAAGRSWLTRSPALGVSTLITVGPLIGVAAIFSRLTIEIDDDVIRASFGFGWPKKEFRLDTIESVASVRNPWWYGWGIRLTPVGQLWNVAGLDAVELRFHSGGRFRLGTDEPEALTTAIEEALLVSAQ